MIDKAAGSGRSTSVSSIHQPRYFDANGRMLYSIGGFTHAWADSHMFGRIMRSAILAKIT